MSKKGDRIQPRDFVFEDELVDLGKSSLAREQAITHLGELDDDTRESVDQQLCFAIYQFVLGAIDEAKPPPFEVRNRLRKIVQQAKLLDELITGERTDGHAAEPLPAIRHALTAPSAIETGKTNIAGVSVEGITFADDAPVIAAIQGVRAIERWVSASLPRYERSVQNSKGGRQSGIAKAEFLSTLGDIFEDATGRLPTLSADSDGQGIGQFADFADQALEALIRSFLPAFYRAAPKIHDAITRLADSRRALYKALEREVGILKASRALKRKE